MAKRTTRKPRSRPTKPLSELLKDCPPFRRGELHRTFSFLVSDLKYLRRRVGGLGDELLSKEKEPEKPEKQQLLVNLLEHLKQISEHIAQAPYMAWYDELGEEALLAIDRIEELPHHVDHWLSRLYEAQGSANPDWLRIFVDLGKELAEAANHLNDDVNTCRDLAGKIRQDP